MTHAKFRDIQEKLNLYEDSMASSVLRFMVAFEQLPVPQGSLIPPEDFKLAEALIQEEVTEMAEGFNKLAASQSLENMTEFVDGAIDSIYVILWAMLKFGVPVDTAFSEVQRSNMAKLNPDGSFSKFPEGHPKAGKVKKAEGWTPPDLHAILRDHRDQATWKSGMQIHSEQDGYQTGGEIKGETP